MTHPWKREGYLGPEHDYAERLRCPRCGCCAHWPLAAEPCGQSTKVHQTTTAEPCGPVELSLRAQPTQREAHADDCACPACLWSWISLKHRDPHGPVAVEPLGEHRIFGRGR